MSRLNKILIKGDLKEGIRIIVDPKLGWEEIRKLIIEEIKAKENFFRGSQVYVDLQGKHIDADEWKDFQELIFERYGIMLSKELIRVKFYSSNTAKIILGPVRSGKSLYSKDNLLIIGDVNSGSEVISHGSIFVLGKVRGSLYAGYGNNEKATIFALELEPERVQIANQFLNISLMSKVNKKLGYWIYLENGEIKINSYSGGKKNG